MTHPFPARAARAQTPSNSIRLRALPRAVAGAVAAIALFACAPSFAADSTASGASTLGAQATPLDRAAAAALGDAMIPDGDGVQPVQLLGWRVESNDAKLLAAATGQWGAQDTKALGVDASGRADAQKLAAALQARALRANFVSVYTQIDPPVGVIRISLMPIHVTQTGRNNYIRFFTPHDGKSVSTHQLEAATRLTQDAAAINGDHVAISLSNPNPSAAADASASATGAAASTSAGNAMPLSINSQPAGQTGQGSKTSGGGVTVSDYGSRYSSPDTITESFYTRLADGVQGDVSASQGLPGLPPHGDDSKGGHFYSESAGVRAVTPEGEASVRVSHTDYRQGGPLFRDFDVNGTIDRVDAQFSKPLSQTLTGNVAVVGVSQRQSIGVADLNDRQNFVFLQAGVDYNGALGYASARVMQGLAGSDNYNVAPLNGAFNPNFTAFALDLNKSIALAPRWSASLGVRAQVGSSGTPSAAQFYSQNAGFDVGNIAGPDGAELSARINYAATPRWTLYGGVDATAIKPVSLSTQTESSVVIGARTALPYRTGGLVWTGDVALAVPTHAPTGGSHSPELRFVLSSQF